MPADPETPLIRDLMRFKPEDLTPNGWAVRAGVSRTVWADMRRHDNPSRKTLDKLLAAAGSSLAEFEALRIGQAPIVSRDSAGPAVGDVRAGSWRSVPLPPIPVIHSSMAGEWQDGSGIEMISIDRSRRVGQVERPMGAVGADAYAVTIVGDSMWPRFRPGRRILVVPNAPIAIGDDVIVTLHRGASDRGAGELALIKQIARRTASFVELRQYNPDVTFRVEMVAVGDIQKIAGELF